MKKLFSIFAFIILSATSFAQIGPINAEQPKAEFLANTIYDKENNEFALIISSDNQFEDELAIFFLGNTPEESIMSLKNLKDAIRVKDTRFKLQDYNISVYMEGRALVHIPYTAGSYNISDEMLSQNIRSILDHFNIPYGELVSITVRSINITQTGMVLSLNYETGLSKYVHLDKNLKNRKWKNGTKVTDYLNFKVWDTLTYEQLTAVENLILEGIFVQTETTDLFLQIMKEKHQ